MRGVDRAGESIIVFPGGAREVFKRKGEQYHNFGGINLRLPHRPLQRLGELNDQVWRDLLRHQVRRLGQCE